MPIDELDLTELRRIWRRRGRAAEKVRRRIDPRGMTRPARSAEEREWLQQGGQESVFVEVDSRDSNTDT